MLCCSWNCWSRMTRLGGTHTKLCYSGKKIIAVMQHGLVSLSWSREDWAGEWTLRSYSSLMFTFGNTKEGHRYLSVSKPNFSAGTLFSGPCELVMLVASWSTHIKLLLIMKVLAFNIKYHSYCSTKTRRQTISISSYKRKHLKYLEDPN